ncbi:hypothetical protein QR680_018733 [Steinernema hermaphroditum]|uniref:Peptidase M16 N-terminal domain-containing protein n=1 Tax=Steinernema hermaphroditum TaxID=289476 RepID=A0AA39LRJ3_9BILA|nr:hypothetical protein QR680_018733 [Steinernema hermaphroditum]
MVISDAKKIVPNRRWETVDGKPFNPFPSLKKKHIDLTTRVVKRYPDIEKISTDNRQYRGLELPNGLKVLLISDPSKSSCAASMDVHVGSCADPENIPGMAHLCEHMLYQGSAKYPAENDQSSFVQRCGGYRGAFTQNEWTYYFFEIPRISFQEALDRFVHLFISPLFTESSIEGEVEAVDSEFRNGQKRDDIRMARLYNALSRPGHDVSKFGTGNRQTLMDIPKSRGINIRDEVVKFYENHYSSNVMSLCVVGPQPLNRLEKRVLVLPLHKIPNRNLKPKLYTEHYYGPEETGFRMDVVPVNNQRRLTMTFPTQTCSSHTELKPSTYLYRMLMYQGKGSLAHELRQRGWSNELGVVSLSGLSAIWTELDIWIDLSKEGLEHVEDIVELLFLYIGLLRRNEPRRVRTIKSVSTSKNNVSAWETAVFYSQELRYCPLEDVALGLKFNAASIENFMRQLTPRNMIYFVTTKDNSTLEGLQREQYYGIEYRKTKLESALLERFERALDTESEFFWMPEKKPLLAEMPNKTPETKEGEGGKKGNTLRVIERDEFRRIWYFEEHRSHWPFAKIEAFLTLPNVAVDPQSQAMAQLFVQCFKYETREEFYDAERAGLEAKVTTCWRGLKFDFSATDDRTCQVVGDYIRRLVSFVPQRKVFDVVFDALRQEMGNFDVEQPYDQGKRLLDYVLTEGSWPNWKLLQALDLVTFETFVDFIPTMWSALHFELLARGRLTEDDVVRLCSDIVPQNDARVRPLSPEELKPLRGLKIPAGVSYFYVHKQAIHSNNCVVFFLQVGQGAISCVLLELLVLMMREQAFHTLRTKEHLGYFVATERRKFEHSKGHGLCIIVQGAYDPEFVEERIEAFLENFEGTLLQTSDEDFRKSKNALPQRRKYHWNEIETKRYLFDDDKRQESELRELKKKSLLQFYKSKIMPDSDKRQKVSIWVRSTIDSAESEERKAQKNGLFEIKDLKQFKITSPRYD